MASVAATVRTPDPAPKTVLETILDWSQGRPVWQRDALRRIIAGGRLSPADIQELTDLCKKGRGAQDITLEPLALAREHLPANPDQDASVSLASIADAQGVNNLAPGQTLTFEEKGLTVIYGDNGAGKSGYARILKRACRARYAGEIEPNIFAAQAPPKPAASFVYNAGTKRQLPEKWQDDDHPHPTLSAISVFDRDCASVHIAEQNEVAFRPFGLDVPDELAHACQSVKEALAAEQKKLEQSRHPLFSKPSWKETTAVGRALAALRHDTDLRALTALSTLTGEETDRLNRLREDLSKDPAKAAAEQKLKADSIKRLLDGIKTVAAATTNEALASILSLDRAAAIKREAARLAAEKAFSGDPLEGVGGEVWRSLWEAARRYSVEIAYPGEPFPPSKEDALCVLCQQPLESEARERMERFETFIREDTEQQAQQAEEAARRARQQLASLSIRLAPWSANLQQLRLQNPDLAKRTCRFLAGARLRRYRLMKCLGTDNPLRLVDAPPNPADGIASVEANLRKYADELQRSAAAEERRKLEREYAELVDRVLLREILQTVQDEVARLKAIHFLGECIADTATNAITKLGNDIADTVITPKLRDRFQQEIVKLAAEKVRVEIVRSGGRYGSPQYQVRLFVKPDAKLQDILSEGEQTCVALAAFLTELATATHQSALIFDDPVSSLDHRWRKRVATRLVEEAACRQIIVFTHDLIFVNDLADLADQSNTPVRLVTVARGQAGTGMVSDGLPWKGKSVEDRIDKLEKAARQAKKLHEENKDDEYSRAAVAIYGDLRASWERTLEEIVFSRVVQRHRDYIDAKNLRKVTVLCDADCDIFQKGFKKCCDVVDAHDPPAVGTLPRRCRMSSSRISRSSRIGLPT